MALIVMLIVMRVMLLLVTALIVPDASNYCLMTWIALPLV